MLSPVVKLVNRLRQAVQADVVAGLRDAELLERFRSTREEAAFGALVERHGPLVFGVCRRVLQNAHDAEDAYQATFLVLARRASAIRKPASLASWLYGVGFRLAKKMKMHASKRQRREREAPHHVSAQPVDPAQRELQAAVDVELQRLPDSQRQPLLLCYLEGLSQEEAAAQLGWPRGTLKRRLERGRAVLRERLTSRGFKLAAGFVATCAAADALATTAPAAVSAVLPRAAGLFSTGHDIAGIVSHHVIALAEGVVKTMLAAKIRVLAFLVILVGASLGAAAICRHYLPSSSVVGESARIQGSKSSVEQGPTPISDKDPPKDEVSAILDKAIAAHGGRDAIEKYEGAEYKMKVTIAGNDPKPKEWKWIFTAPNSLMEVREGYYLGKRNDSIWEAEGKSVWQIVEGKKQPVRGKIAQAFVDDAYLLHICRLVPLNGKDFELAKVDEIKVEDKPAVGLRVASKGHKDVTLYFDKDSGLLVKAVRKAISTSTLEEVAEERFFQEYKKQDGLMIANKVVVKHGGKTELEVEVTETKLLANEEDKVDRSTKAKEEFESLKKQYEKALAENPQEAKNTYLPRFNALADRYGKETVSFDMLVYVIRQSNGPYFPEEGWDRTMELLAEQHVTDDRLNDLIATMTVWGDAAGALMRAILENHGDKVTRARACKMLLRMRRYDIVAAEEYLAKPNLQRNFEQRTINGKAYYRKVVANLDDNRKEAEELGKLLKGKYSGVLPELAWNKPIPDAVLTDLGGTQYKLSELKGKIVILNIFSTDTPGRESSADSMIGQQPKHGRKYQGKPVVVFNICTNEKKEAFVEYLKKHPTPACNCWVGARSEFAYDWHDDRPDNPNCLLIDADGNLRMHGVAGNILEDQLDEKFALMGASGKLGKPTRATEAFVELQDKYEKAVAENNEKRTTARTGAELEELDRTAPRRTFGVQFNDLAEKYADDPASFYILQYNLFAFCRWEDKPVQTPRALELLAKHHAGHADMRNLLQSTRELSLGAHQLEVKRLATAVFEKSADRTAQGYACRLLMHASESELRAAQYYLDNPDFQEGLEKERPDGREYYKKLVADMDKIKLRITEYEALLKDKYAGLLEEEVK
jgi:RNA polymerase sigma factor (sigma-70 family)